MSFQWLKPFFPRGLYGRAALILLLPVVVLQVIVAVLFAQRHFTAVTEQMTNTMMRELSLVLATAAATETPDGIADALNARLPGLGFSVEVVPQTDLPSADTRLWYDFSATVFSPMLRARFPELQRIILADDSVVDLYFNTVHGLTRVVLPRNLVSASKSHQLYVYLLFFGVVLPLIAFIYLRNQLRPIKRLATAAEAFGRGRHIPYTPAGATEVRAAGTAFLDMRQRIERHIEQRTLMLSGVSHDLRTPLTRMRLELSLLDEDVRAPLEQDVDEMHRLVDEFLNFVKGASEGDPEPTDPFDLVADIVAAAKRGGKDVDLISVAGIGTIPLRPVAIRRAIDNLVSNAVRYGSRAELSVALTDKSLRIRVEDNGPGIPDDQTAEAQKPFTRLDKSRNQDRGAGVGLGLAIATDIARAHGGVLRLASSERLGGLCADIVIAR